MKKTPMQLSIRFLLSLILACALLLLAYSNIRHESFRQTELVKNFVDKGGGFHELEEAPPRFGRKFGLDYPADKIYLAKSQARGHWAVPGWKCTDEDLELLKGLANLTERYIDKSELSDEGLRLIAGLPKIELVQFGLFKLSQCNLEILASSESISSLQFVRSEFDSDSLDRFREKRPECCIFVSNK